ncbi:MAG: TIGR00730 family Rossman fold protein [Cyclobacteriaceae bacterium]|nr:TIGR00730 family Rossman fold protein [Cyclobacteriaceae bacterium]
MNICVFCGSSTGSEPIYKEAAHELGTLIGSSHHTLIYGGGNVGLMGIVADATLAAGGKVVGVIPEFLQRREVAHNGLTQLEVVDTMHQRKQRMAEMTDAFIAMPGGWGTLDELAEILTWRQLGLIQSSIGILNTNKFFDHLLAQMNLMTRHGFLGEGSLGVLKVEQQPHQLLTQLGVFSVQAG